MFIHLSYHVYIHLLCIPITYYVHMLAIGAPEGVTLLEFETEQQEDQQEV
jgi:hypothetical protein